LRDRCSSNQPIVVSPANDAVNKPPLNSRQLLLEVKTRKGKEINAKNRSKIDDLRGNYYHWGVRGG
jgi:hypothetical protein